MQEEIQLKDLSIQFLYKDYFKVIKFIGKISNDNGFELNKKYNSFFEDKVYNVIIDLSELNFINSTGIAIIFSMFFKCSDNEGKLVIGGIHPFVEKVLKIMTLPNGFKIYKTYEEALKEFTP